MVRPRDSKGRFISEGKFLVGIFGPKHVPHITTSDHYMGSASRQEKARINGGLKNPHHPPQ